MNIDEGGAMDFEAIMKNDKFIKAIDEAEKRVKGFSSATVAEGGKIDDVFDITAENIKIQKDVIASLESQLKNLNAEISKLSPGKAQAELRQQAIEVSAELKAEKESLSLLEGQVKQTQTSSVSFRTELRLVRDELIAMEAAGKRNTAEYQALQARLGQMTDAMGDAQTQAKIMSDDYYRLSTAMEMIGGVTGAFTAAQGAVGLFAGENEHLQKIMLKVQSLMGITIGLQQVQKILNKDSYTQIVFVRRAKEMLAIAETKFAVALGISNVAAKALMATLTLGLSVAITAVVYLINRYISKSNEAQKATEEFNKSVVDLAGKPVATIEELSVAWSQLGDNIKAKEKFIDDNSEKFKTLGVSIKNVKEAEDLLINNKGKFIESLVLRAKAMASAELASEKYKQAIQKQLELENTPKKVTKERVSMSVNGAPVAYEQYTVDNEKYKELTEAKNKLEKEGLDLFKKSAEFSEQEKKILKDIGVSSNKITEGSITALENSISRLKDKYKDAANDKERANLLKQIRAQEKVLDKMDQSDSSKKDSFKDNLDKRKKQYQEYFKWINSNDPILQKAADTEFAGMLKQGKSFLEYLKNQRDKIMSVSDQTVVQKSQLKAINNAIAEESKKTVLQDFETALQKQMNSATSVIQMLDIIAKKRKELSSDGTDVDTGKKEILDKADKSAQEQAKKETDKIMEEYASYLTKRVELQRQYTDDMILLEKRLKEAQTSGNSEDIAKIKATISNRKSQFEKDNKFSGDEDYDAMLEKFKSFEEKRQSIIEDYAKKKQIAQAHGDTELQNKLIKEESKALLQNSFDQLKASPDYIRAFEELRNVSTQTLNSLLERFEAVKSVAANSLNPEDLREYTDTMMKIVNELNSRDPFTAIKNGYKELKVAEKELSIAQKELDQIRANGGEGSEKEKDAIEKVNKAKDNYVKKNNEVKKSEKIASDAVKDLFDNLSDVGDAIGGEAGQIVSIIGDIGSFTMGAISSFKTASEASAGAIKTLEKASIILAIISAAYQVATKITSLFGADTAEYDKAKEAYEAYLDVLDEVIAKQKELVETMTGENAINSYEYALSLIQKSTEAARELGKERLNAGASMGSSSYGVRQRKRMNESDWDAARAALGDAYSSSIRDGRMTGLFDLSAEQLEKLQREAPLFWAKLDDDAKEYLQTIIDSTDAVEEMKNTLNESITGITFDSLSDNFLDTLQSMDSSAQTFSNNFSEYMRKALIQNMFNTQFKEQLNQWYQAWSDAMKPSSEEGVKISINEQKILDDLKGSIISGAMDATKSINEQFKTDGDVNTSLTGAVKGITEETASLLGGQTNAIRINQIESISILRNQIMILDRIAANTSYNYHLAKLDEIADAIKYTQTDPLRSKGLI